MKKLRLELESLAVETFSPQSDVPEGGTVRGHDDDWTWSLSGCDTCRETCDAGDATCGASCGTACRASVNTPDCWTKVDAEAEAEFAQTDEPI